MEFPISTGQAARLLGATEPQLSELVRHGKVSPPPTVFAGRRLWQPALVRQAAEALGTLTPELSVELDRAEAGEEVRS